MVFRQATSPTTGFPSFHSPAIIASVRGDLPLAAEFCCVTMASIVHPNRYFRIYIFIKSQFVLIQASCLLTLLDIVNKVKVVFIYLSIQSVGPLKPLYTFCLPWQTCSFRNRSDILTMQQLRANTKSLTFPPLSIARY